MDKNVLPWNLKLIFLDRDARGLLDGLLGVADTVVSDAVSILLTSIAGQSKKVRSVVLKCVCRLFALTCAPDSPSLTSRP